MSWRFHCLIIFKQGKSPILGNEYRKAFSDDSSSEVHQQLDWRKVPQTYSPCEKDCSYRSFFCIHQSVCRGDHCVFENSHLQSHQKGHAKEKPFKCEYRESINQSAPLITHMNSVPGGVVSCLDRCSMYEKGFSHSLDLSSIVRVYIEEESHESEEKGNVFNENSCLQAHQKIHTEEKRYTDVECEKGVIGNSDLNIQHRVHMEEIPYNSEACANGFSLASHFQNHQIVHTRNNPINVTCGNSLKPKFAFPRHQKLTSERNLTRCVGMASTGIRNWKIIRESTLARGRTMPV